MPLVEIIGVEFVKGNLNTDFRHLITSNANSLFIYNENVEQYNDKTDYSAGGGNGAIRPYRVDGTKLKAPLVGAALGVPTMYTAKLTEMNQQFAELIDLIDAAFVTITEYVKTNHIKKIYWSADAEGKLGMDIAKSRLKPAMIEIIKKRFADCLATLDRDVNSVKPVRSSK
jgi:hypothetical protein